MRKHLYAVWAALIVLCSAASSVAGSEHATMNVVVDPRIELLTIVQLLTDFESRSTFVTELDYSYKKDVLAHFSRFAGHDAPVMYPDMMAYGFAYDAPVQALLHCSSPPELKRLFPMPQNVLARSGGSESLDKFLAAMRDFASSSGFMDFFAAHRAYYDSVIASVQKDVADEDYVTDLEEYCGAKQHSYTLVLALLQSTSGYGPRVPTPDGAMDVYFVTGPAGINNGLPFFGNKNNFEYMAWHEFGHSFLNPLVDSNAAEIMEYASLFGPISSRMKEQAYGDWKACATEHLLRAANIRMVYRKHGKETGDRAVEYNRTKGFAYTEDLCRKLEEYEAQRDKYPTLASFFPELIGVFKRLADANLGAEYYEVPFFGTINAVVTDKKAAVLIVPTRESDKAVQDSIVRSVQYVRDHLFKGSPIFDDTVALKKDLSDKSIVAYGTEMGNLWIAQIMPKLPVRIESDRIVADSVYEGTNLRFITAWPNPRNPQRGIVIYTAQQAGDIVGINGLFHGPTDYVVARGKEVLKAGFYNRKGSDWVF